MSFRTRIFAFRRGVRTCLAEVANEGGLTRLLQASSESPLRHSEGITPSSPKNMFILQCYVALELRLLFTFILFLYSKLFRDYLL